MNFSSAVQVLIEAHTSEVRALQSKIYCLRGLDTSIQYLPEQTWCGSDIPSIDTPASPTRRHAEHHLVPLLTPGLKGASNSKGHLISKSSPRNNPLLVTPPAPMIPYTPHDLWSPHDIWSTRLHSCSHLDPMQSSVRVSIGTDSVVDFKGCDNDGFIDGEAICSEGRKQVSFFKKNLNEYDVDLEEHFEFEASDIEDADVTADWIQRWVLLTDGLLNNREFVVHPGWTPEFYSRASESEQTVNGKSLASVQVGAVTFNVAPSQKAALARQERQMMDNRSRSTLIQGSRPGSRKYFRRKRFSGNGRSTRSSASGISTLISHPASPFRKLWVLLCVSVIMYEVFALTMEPFDVIPEKVEKVIEWTFLCYWSLDIVVNFFSGIYIDGKVETRFSKVALNYLRTWFAFDIIVVSTQAVPLIADTGDIDAAVVFRILRCLRSLRLARVFFWLKDELALSSTIIAGGKFLQFFFGLIFFLHCSACMWYEVGKADDGWISRYEKELGSSAGLRYLASLHWALAQLQGNTNIYPGASYGDLLGVVLSSYASILVLTFFVSSMTDVLFSERARRKNKIDENRLVFRFFGRHDINEEVRARAEHYLQLKQKQQHWMEGNEQDSKVLAMFPAPLRALLLAEMRAFCLTWHPIFAYLQRYHRSVFVKVCSKILTSQTYEPNDDVFTFGEVGSHAFYILKGDFVFNAKFDLLSTVSLWVGQRAKRTRESDVSMKSMSEASFSESASKGLKVSVKGIRSSISNWFYRGASSSEMVKAISGRSTCQRDSYESGDSVDYRGDKSGEEGRAVFSDTDKFVKQNRPVRRLRSADTVSEVSLWLSWVHAGDLCSLEYGEAMLISNSALVTLLTNHPSDHAIFYAYAARFRLAAKKIRQANNTDQLIELMGFRAVLEVEQELARTERGRSFAPR